MEATCRTAPPVTSPGSSPSHSGQNGDCVEWAPGLVAQGTVPFRDSEVPKGPNVTFTLVTWVSFTSAVGRGELGAG
ncbi:DUF397 domain-containing protein [Streptomyces sp. AJS327]|uniref:DUF397 domain-containing protein n=1 Tax=Streptomyces sp. AJS327 TaxID=2545265 RepID=UPI0015DE86D6|nr:DUF397 domain-containing protein [Streptomyces sp. AJS327]MBA0050224.1 DUF397 domain-containing protein [Streptomyces sp. AJS327]